ncbi:hypothetical protein GDO86_013839 [Hymenochirus boettgeri]|uniref:Protein-glutamine gamma-glutamyltransferase 2 n=1 Tax=Hymenochirus boettgeri TaxID=247094 RepID=A0A8T2JLQ0_9PIPI|nr:hypothetical protein GDO86_013839 [Hymenochirus boettgeri]
MWIVSDKENNAELPSSSTNNRSHHTSDAGCDRLIVRRGQPFQITLNFSNRGYEDGVDKLALGVQTGPCPSEEFGTMYNIPVSEALQEGEWSAAISSTEGTKVVLSITSPPNARIGRYNLSLETSTEFQESSFQIDSFILLFNPWCPEDSVYLEQDDERKEYVLSQHGIIFQGTQNLITDVPWNYGQFLNASNKDCSRRNDPGYISRVVSAMRRWTGTLDKVVFFGRWDNRLMMASTPCSDGKVDILRRVEEIKLPAGEIWTVWVYAAVACSAVLDENGKRQKKHKDIIWNFHCWVEGMDGRPDLGEFYNGWQVVDPTPQEKSEGTYCCGPAPVIAVKEGDIHLKYDVMFVFAEVNADAVYYVEQKDGSVRKTHFISLVGQKISTKAVGNDKREDITLSYKYPEGSEDERRVFEKANKSNLVEVEDSSPAEITMKIKGSEGMDKGNDFDVFAVITNNTEEEKKCRLMLCARTTTYNGRVEAECGTKDLLNLTLSSQEEKVVPLRILYEKYGPTLTEDNTIKVMALLQEYASERTVLAMRDIYVKNPAIKIRFLGEHKQKRKLVAEVSMINPLSEPLTSCCFTMEGAGLTEEQLIETLDCPVEPGQDAKVRVNLMPQQSGLLKLIVDFESDRLKAVKGYKNIIIAPLPK